LKGVPFFKQQLEESKKQGELGQQTFEFSDLLEISKSITLEKFEIGQYVFKHQEVGNKFYIILKGEVGVYVPEEAAVSEEKIKERQENSHNLFQQQMKFKERAEL